MCSKFENIWIFRLQTMSSGAVSRCQFSTAAEGTAISAQQVVARFNWLHYSCFHHQQISWTAQLRTAHWLQQILKGIIRLKFTFPTSSVPTILVMDDRIGWVNRCEKSEVATIVYRKGLLGANRKIRIFPAVKMTAIMVMGTSSSFNIFVQR